MKYILLLKALFISTCLFSQISERNALDSIARVKGDSVITTAIKSYDLQTNQVLDSVLQDHTSLIDSTINISKQVLRERKTKSLAARRLESREDYKERLLGLYEEFDGDVPDRYIKRINLIEDKLDPDELEKLKDYKNHIGRFKRRALQKKERIQKFSKLDSATVSTRLKEDSTGLRSSATDSLKTVAANKLNSDQFQAELLENESLSSSNQLDNNILEGYSPQEFNSRQNRDFTQNKLRTKLQKFKNGESDYKDFKERVNESQEELRKYKKRYRNIRSKSDLDKNSLRSAQKIEPAERFKYAINFQLLQGEPITLDLSPQISYLIWSRLSTGLGITYRLGISSEWEEVFNKESEIFGGRVFSDYKIFKSFYLHAEYESLWDAQVSKKIHNPTEQNIYGGLMKKFKVTKGVTGQIQLLYDFYDEGYWLDAERLTYRIGFEISGFRKKNIKGTL